MLADTPGMERFSGRSLHDLSIGGRSGYDGEADGLSIPLGSRSEPKTAGSLMKKIFVGDVGFVPFRPGFWGSGRDGADPPTKVGPLPP